MSINSEIILTETQLQIIKATFRLLNIEGLGMTAGSEDYNYAADSLNRMIKVWAKKGPHLWAEEEGILFLSQYTGKYNIGNNESKATKVDSLLTLQLSGIHNIGVTTLVVNSTSNLLANDNIGIVLSDNRLFWSTVSSIMDSTHIIISDSLPLSANDKALVFDYTTNLEKPLAINSSTVRLVAGYDGGPISSLIETPIELLAYSDFMKLPNKTINNDYIMEATYLPKNKDTAFYVYPRPTNCSYRIQFTYARDLALLLNTSDELDFPQEWQETVIYQLAIRLARPFGRADALQDLAPMASQMLKDLISQDQENNYIQISPNTEEY